MKTSALLPWVAVLIALVYFQDSSGMFMESHQPVLWRSSKTKVVSGATAVRLRIKLLDTCHMLSGDGVHADLLKNAQDRCQELYKSNFLDQLAVMCPRTTGRLLVRKRRFLFLTALLIAGIVAAVGVGATGIAVGSVALVKTNNLSSRVDETEAEQRILREQDALMKTAIKRVESRIHELYSQVESTQAEVAEIKRTMIPTSYAVAHIAASLTAAKFIMQEASRRWEAGQLYAPFLDFFNFTLPCGTNCPVAYAVPERCNLINDNEIWLDFHVPEIDPNQQLVEADPFVLMHRFKNTTCQVVYTGPSNALIATNGSCIYSTNLQIESVRTDTGRGTVLSEHGECRSAVVMATKSKYFGVGRCNAPHPHDQNEFLQVKRDGNNNYVYCPNNNITIHNLEMPCPDNVFVLPQSMSFSVAKYKYQASNVTITIDRSAVPDLTHRVNMILGPKFNRSALLDDPIIHSNLEVDRHAARQAHTTHIVTWVAVSVLILALVIIAIILCCYCQLVRSRLAAALGTENVGMKIFK